MKARILCTLATFFFATTNCFAVSALFQISADGIQEVNAGGVPNGDPDGSAIGTILLDNGTGVGTTGSATINLTLANLDMTNFTGHHIHQAPSTTTGGIVLDFGDPDSMRIGNVLSGTIINLSAATVSNVFANPTGFYYNLHNSVYPSGAVRDQLPEPGTLALLATAICGLIGYRRR